MMQFNTIIPSIKRIFSSLRTLPYGVLLLSMLLLSTTLLTPVTAQVRRVTYYYTDLQGSVISMADERGNKIATPGHASSEAYAPFGSRLSWTTNSQNQPLTYTGKPEDRETSLMYLGGRHYNGLFGRFYQLDPIPFKPGHPFTFNRYAYANNNPYKFTDPNGLQAEDNYGGNQEANRAKLYAEYGNGFDSAVERNKLFADPIRRGAKVAGDALEMLSPIPTSPGEAAAMVVGGGAAAKVGGRLFSKIGRFFAKKPEAKVELVKQFSESAIESAVRYAIDNKNNRNHIFHEKHKLQSLVAKLGGEENTMKEILKAADGKLPDMGLFDNVQINIGGETVHIRGFVHEGIPKMATMFIE